MSHKLSPGAVEVSLPEVLENRLKSYSMVAAATGVSILALAYPADAEVVITHKIIPVAANSTVSIDINNDGIADFQFKITSSIGPIRTSSHNAIFFGSYVAFGAFTVKPLGSGGGIIGGPLPYLRHGTYASALKRDVMITRFKPFVSKNAIIERGSGGCGSYSCYNVTYGNWRSNPQNRFLGVKFQIDGETHYGWVRMKLFEIESYAYETEPDTPICAREIQPCPAPPDDDAAPGETGQNVSGPSLGMLALGADGLALWRREALAF
jgi:hypothetical protein